MLRAALVAFSVAAVTASALAQSTGVAVCEDFIRKLEICINTRIPATERATFERDLDVWREAFANFEKSARILSELYRDKPGWQAEWKAKVEDPFAKACKSTADFKKLQLRDFGCAF